MNRSIFRNAILASAIMLTAGALTVDLNAQSSVLRPSTQAPAQAKPKAPSSSRYHSKYNYRKANRSYQSTPQQPSLTSIYNSLDERYDWHSELSDGMILVSKDDLFGFVDRQGEEVIAPIYEGASDFENGEAIVMLNDLYGTINRSGAMVVPIKYDGLDGPTYDFYAVSKDGKWGYIDRHGFELVPPRYDSAQPFAFNLGIVSLDGRYGAVDKAGNEIIPVIFQKITTDSVGRPEGVMLYNRYAAIDSTLNIDYNSLFDRIGRYGELGPANLALVSINNRYGLINKDMHEILPVEYEHIGKFNNGHALVKHNGTFNYVNPEGKLLLENNISSGKDFVGDYALATVDGKSGVLDHSGTFQPVEFDHGLGVIKRNGGLSIITAGGVPVNDLIYQEVHKFNGDRAIVKRAGNYGFIDTDGYEIVKPIYDEVIDYDGNAARVCMRDLWGLIDKNGVTLAANVYQEIEPFVDDLARVKRARQYGYIGRNGLEAVHATYDELSEFEADGLARTKKASKYGLVDKKGHEPVIATYDYMSPLADNLYAVGIAGKYGFISPDGTVAIKLKYDETLPFVNGLAPVRKKDKWGLIDTTGHTVIPIKYEPFEDISGDTIIARKSGEITVYDRQGKKVKQP